MSEPNLPSLPKSYVIACINDHPKAMILLRAAKRHALEKGLRWRVVYVETPSHMQSGEDEGHERMLHLLTLAGQMGGEAAHLEAETVEKGITNLLEEEKGRVALFIIGSTEPEGLRKWRKSTWKRLAKIACQYAPVEIVPLSGPAHYRTVAERLHIADLHAKHLLCALGAVAAAAVLASCLEWLLPPALFRINNQNVALLFMIACAFTAGRYGLLPGLLASVASFLVVNYSFTVPYHTIKIMNVTDTINMALFLFAALLISLFTSQTRGYAERAARRELSTKALFTLYRIASSAFSRQQALEKLQPRLTRMMGVDVAFFIPTLLNPDKIDIACPADLKLSEEDFKALSMCWNEIKTTGAASPYNPGTMWRFEPMISPSGEIGVLGVRPRAKKKLDAWFGRLLTAIADQTATILEHLDLERSMEATRVREEREKLRSMLLSSVSHDLKTPLAAIIGTLSVHRSLRDRLPMAKQQELIETALEEAQRLDSFITNILDMTRLESGQIVFKHEWHDMLTLIQQVVKRMQHRLRQREVIITCPADVEVKMDTMMTGQVWQNLIDNACKYTTNDTRIELECHVDEEKGLICSVRDSGIGLPEDKLERVFDKYARLQKEDSQVAGTGFGLAISKAVMEAQGGWIVAGNHPQGGALFTFCLPKWRRQRTMERAHA